MVINISTAIAIVNIHETIFGTASLFILGKAWFISTNGKSK